MDGTAMKSLVSVEGLAGNQDILVQGAGAQGETIEMRMSGGVDVGWSLPGFKVAGQVTVNSRRFAYLCCQMQTGFTFPTEATKIIRTGKTPVMDSKFGSTVASGASGIPTITGLYQ